MLHHLRNVFGAGVQAFQIFVEPLQQQKIDRSHCVVANVRGDEIRKVRAVVNHQACIDAVLLQVFIQQGFVALEEIVQCAENHRGRLDLVHVDQR